MSLGPAHSPARAIWARTTLHVWPESSSSRACPSRSWARRRRSSPEPRGSRPWSSSATRFRSRSGEGLARVRPEGPPSREAGPYRAITLDVNIDLGVVGYLAPAAVRLAEAGVSIVPQCAYSKDHLLVREADLEAARAVLEALIAERARSPLESTPPRESLIQI